MGREGVGLGLALRLMEVLHVRRVAASSVVWRHRLPLTRWSHSIHQPPEALVAGSLGGRIQCGAPQCVESHLHGCRGGRDGRDHHLCVRETGRSQSSGVLTGTHGCSRVLTGTHRYSPVLTGTPQRPTEWQAAGRSQRDHEGPSGSSACRLRARRVVMARKTGEARPWRAALRWRRRTVREFPQNDSLRT